MKMFQKNRASSPGLRPDTHPTDEVLFLTRKWMSLEKLDEFRKVG
jgi:hypothetical protein